MIGSHPFQVLSPAKTLAIPDDVAVWTQRQYDIVQTLALRVRIMAATQATDIWCSDQTSAADVIEAFDQLVSSGLVERYLINAHPLLEPVKPLATWSPDLDEPDSKSISISARRRWTHPAKSTEVFAASKKAANLFGSDAHGLPPLEHRDHDLLLADAYVAYRRHRAVDASHWVGEHFLPKAGFQIKDPDAFLVDDHGKPFRIVESAGRYSPRQVETFHDHCASLELPYELW